MVDKKTAKPKAEKLEKRATPKVLVEDYGKTPIKGGKG